MTTKQRIHRDRDLPVIFVRPAEAEKMYGISRGKLYQLMQSGVLPSAKIGAARLIRCTDIEALIERELQC